MASTTTANQVLGQRYEVLEKCGRGGQGFVFKIKDLKESDDES